MLIWDGGDSQTFRLVMPYHEACGPSGGICMNIMQQDEKCIVFIDLLAFYVWDISGLCTGQTVSLSHFHAIKH